MEALIDRYPDDLNAQTFLALGVMGGYETDEHPREGELTPRRSCAMCWLGTPTMLQPITTGFTPWKPVRGPKRRSRARTHWEALHPTPRICSHAGPYLLAGGKLRKGAPILRRSHAR